MRKAKRLLALLITLVFVMSFLVPGIALANNSNAKVQGKQIAPGQLKKMVENKFLQGYSVMEQSKIKVKGKGIDFDVPPVIKQGRTLIPVRAITQGLGADVDWDAETGTITITKGSTVIEFIWDDTSGKYIVYVNNKEVEIESPPGMINNRMFVPLRFIAETLGLKVKYKDDGQIDIDEEVGSIEGKVTAETSGNALQGVKVYLKVGTKYVLKATTNSQGKYSIDDIPVGTYTMQFVHNDYQTVTVTGIKVAKDSATIRNVTMVQDEEEELYGEISGTIYKGSEETPLKNAQITIDDGEDYFYTIITGSNGTFKFTNVPVGTYQVVFYHTDYGDIEHLNIKVEENKRVVFNVNFESMVTIITTVDID
ncbi:MAG: stalk domain-containing protein [Bacillota bacterium]